MPRPTDPNDPNSAQAPSQSGAAQSTSQWLQSFNQQPAQSQPSQGAKQTDPYSNPTGFRSFQQNYDANAGTLNKTANTLTHGAQGAATDANQALANSYNAYSQGLKGGADPNTAYTQSTDATNKVATAQDKINALQSLGGVQAAEGAGTSAMGAALTEYAGGKNFTNLAADPRDNFGRTESQQYTHADQQQKAAQATALAKRQALQALIDNGNAQALKGQEGRDAILAAQQAGAPNAARGWQGVKNDAAAGSAAGPWGTVAGTAYGVGDNAKDIGNDGGFGNFLVDSTNPWSDAGLGLRDVSAPGGSTGNDHAGSSLAENLSGIGEVKDLWKWLHG